MNSSITLDGDAIHYTDTGAAHARAPLVLLHGFPLDRRMWQGQVEGLNDVCRVIAIDQRGFGQSASQRPLTMESMADDVHQLLEKIGALPCVLAGLSMGGYVAQVYAMKYSADLKALVLLDTKSEGESEAGKLNRDQMVKTAREKGSKAVADAMQPKMLAEGAQQHRPQIVHRLREMMELCPPLTIEHATLAMRDRLDCTLNLAKLTMPVLFVVGQGDVLSTPSLMEAMCKQTKQGQFAVIPGAGHMAPMEQPEAVNGVLRGFLRKNG